jgi:hypothetical protein
MVGLRGSTRKPHRIDARAGVVLVADRTRRWCHNSFAALYPKSPGALPVAEPAATQRYNGRDHHTGCAPSREH